ncbi:hypothetical protein M2135_003025 [Parabacteroides sp. PF5-9]|nr:hypothetical protein [Parabacteroides sp. PF5-9]
MALMYLLMNILFNVSYKFQFRSVESYGVFSTTTGLLRYTRGYAYESLTGFSCKKTKSIPVHVSCKNKLRMEEKVKIVKANATGVQCA